MPTYVKETNICLIAFIKSKKQFREKSGTYPFLQDIFALFFHFSEKLRFIAY